MPKKNSPGGGGLFREIAQVLAQEMAIFYFH